MSLTSRGLAPARTPQRQTCPSCSWFVYDDPELALAHLRTSHSANRVPTREAPASGISPYVRRALENGAKGEGLGCPPAQPVRRIA